VQAELPIIDAPATPRRLPRWLKRNVPKGNANHLTARTVEDYSLVTVCEEARCPNQMECWAAKTATFMILGDICTRPCGFCAVKRGKPLPPDPEEPRRVAQASRRLGLKHVVLTSVTRDDLEDGGADHYRQCIEAIRERIDASVEVLTPDFVEQRWALDRVVEAAPEVFNHNVETVPRLYRKVRGPKSDYQWTLDLLRRVRALKPELKTKSGLMLGLGETETEVFDVLADLLDAGVTLLTVGQYLKPGDKYLDVVRYLPPEEFDEIGRRAKAMGFRSVASGPFVRSSYHARAMAEGEEA
jgi:lipoic acid synthetase